MTTRFRRHPLSLASLFLLIATPAALMTGCFINVADDGAGGAGGNDTSTSRSSSSSGSGNGGSGTTTSTSAGNGGAGGGSACIGPDGTGQTVASCDLMEITPSTHNGPAASNCDSSGGTGGTDPPPGFSVCYHGFDIFTAGSAENLRACLGMINGAPATACDFSPVVDCITKMYDDACASQLATDSCQLIKDTMCGMTEPFDLTKCTDDMKPFNANGMQRVADCITSSTDPVCQTAYDTCVGSVMDAPVVP